MTVIDHTNTMALLIGANCFPNDATIDPIPNITTNIQALKEILTNKELVGIPEANITISLNETRNNIERKLRDIANKTRNRRYTLLVYYTGHGILSSEDYQLYLATCETSKKDLEIEAVSVQDFKGYIKKSTAGRKIVILDCCHSGAIIGTMGDMSSKIQSELNGFEGTYIMTSAAEDTPSLFPTDQPEKPTFFTGKLVEVIKEGLDVDKECCSLRDIFDEINVEFREKGLPPPQQSNFNNADQLNFALNKKFVYKRPADVVAWEEAVEKNYKWTFIDFKNQFPDSPFAKEARKKIREIEEDESWSNAVERNTVGFLYDYLDAYPNGKYHQEASERIKGLRDRDEKKRREELIEERLWKEAVSENTVNAYKNYLSVYPFGKFSQNAKTSVKQIEEEKEINKKHQKELEEEKFWKEIVTKNSKEGYQQYLLLNNGGKFSEEAERALRLIDKLEFEQLRKEQEEAEREEMWAETIKTKSRSSYETFLINYPTGKFSQDAKNYLSLIEEQESEKLKIERGIQEENLWNKAKSTNKIDLFEEYIELNPDGKFVNDAKAAIESLIRIKNEKGKKEDNDKARQRIWSETNEENTVAGYEKFLNHFKTGEFIEEAKNNIKVLKEKEKILEKEQLIKEVNYWNAIKIRNTRQGYNEYLELYPSGQFRTEAQLLIENLVKDDEQRQKLWEKADQEKSIASYENFLNIYTSGKFTEEARQNVQNLRQEEEKRIETERKLKEETLWKRSLKENNKNSFEEYLKDYPGGAYFGDAKKQIDRLEREKEERERVAVWNKSKKENTIKSYKDFLQSYPTGKYSEDARDKINWLEEKEKQRIEKEVLKEREIWEKTLNKNSIEAYRYFLQSYPAGRFGAEAAHKIETLTEIQFKERERQNEAKERLWKEAIESNNITTLEKFVAAYPTEALVKIAKGKIELLKEEENQKKQREKEIEEECVWEKAFNGNLRDLYVEYLGLFPSGKHNEEAKARLEMLNNIEKEKHEKNQKDKEQDKFWNSCVDKNTINSYEKYLKQYPGGKFSEEAKNNIEILKEKDTVESERKKKEHQEITNLEKRVKPNKREQILAGKDRVEDITDKKNNVSILIKGTLTRHWRTLIVGAVIAFGVIIFANTFRTSTKITPTPDLILQAQIDVANNLYNNMVKVAGGNFTMGQNNTEYESPAHTVTINSFLMSKYEITREEWNVIMGDSTFKSSWRLPAADISWIQTQDFIRRLNALSGKNFRLPTESEWEYTCVKGFDDNYKGNENNFSWNIRNSMGTLHPVGGKLPNRLGIYDMLGNVYEWCSDTLARYNSNPTDTNLRVIRGGNYKQDLDFVSAKIRNWEKSSKSGEGIGFRLAMDF